MWYLLPSGRQPHGGHTYSVGGRPHVGGKRVRSRCLRRLGVPPRPPGTTFIRVSLARSAASLDGSSFVVLTPKWPSVSRGSYLLGWWQATCRGEEGEVKVCARACFVQNRGVKLGYFPLRCMVLIQRSQVYSIDVYQRRVVNMVQKQWGTT